MLLTRPAPALPSPLFGPSGVHWLADCELLLSIVKMRNGIGVWSATSSPSPETLIGFTSVNFQFSSCPALTLLLLVIWSFQSPLTGRILPFLVRLASGNWGLKRPKNGAPPLAIGVTAASSKTVLVKFALLTPLLPTLVNSGIVVLSGAIRTADRSGSFGKLMLN